MFRSRILDRQTEYEFLQACAETLKVFYGLSEIAAKFKAGQTIQLYKVSKSCEGAY